LEFLTLNHWSYLQTCAYLRIK